MRVIFILSRCIYSTMLPYTLHLQIVYLYHIVLHDIHLREVMGSLELETPKR